MTPASPEFWTPRGIGNGHGVCFVTGKAVSMGSDIAGFVRSREAGQRVVDIFEGRARLDYREYEPNWIQVKICAVPEHLDALKRIYDATSKNGGIVYRELVQWAADPVNCRGYEPRFLRIIREKSESLQKVQDIIGVGT
jgi:hypothetical protein